jgi:predicted nucleic acid-binding protein
MILVDTNIWVAHFNRNTSAQEKLVLSSPLVLCHPFIVGELAAGRLDDRAATLAELRGLPMSPVVDHDKVLAFVEAALLMGRGIGWIDLHLLTAVVRGRDQLWTRDRRLGDAAQALGVRFDPNRHP